MNRRQFLNTFLFTLCFSRAITAGGADDTAAFSLPLWPIMPPGGGGPQGVRHVTARGAVSHIATPSLSVLRPVKPNGCAVLIAAGGGYRRIEAAKEAMPAARWLCQRGYTPYILYYRLPDEGWKAGHWVSLQDAQRALRLIRSRHAKVSALGFSAGGHLLAMVALCSDVLSYPVQDALDLTPALVDSVALIYPVITLEAPFTHTSTHKQLVGQHASPWEEAQWSVQNRVTPQAPPFFLVQADNDPISDPQNTRIMAEACRRQGVAVEMHRYPTGGHGFAMGRPGTLTVEWPARYEAWLRRRC